MARLRSIRSFLFVIPFAALLLGMAYQRGQWPPQAANLFLLQPKLFLEDWKNPFQGKSVDPLADLSNAEREESLTIGHLLADKMDAKEWPEGKVRDLAVYIVRKSKQYRVSPYLVLSLIHVESGFRTAVVSSRGAVGLMQLMPSTAEEVAASIGLPFPGRNALENPKVNIELGLRYLQDLKSRFPTRQRMLTAYNIGPAALVRKLRNGEALPLDYYQKVMDAMALYKRQAGMLVTQGTGASTWL